MSYSQIGGWQDQYHFPHPLYEGNMYEEDLADSGWYVDLDNIRYYLDSSGVEYYPLEGVELEEADAFGVEYVVDEYEVPYFAYQDLAPELRQQFATVDRYELEETMVTPGIQATNMVPNNIVCDHEGTAETAVSEISDGHLLDGHHAPRYDHHHVDTKKKRISGQKKKKRRPKERPAEASVDPEGLIATVERILKEKENTGKHKTASKHQHDRHCSKKRGSNKTRTTRRSKSVSSEESGSRDTHRRRPEGSKGRSSRSLARRSVSMSDCIATEQTLQNTRSKHRHRQRHSHPSKGGMGDDSWNKETPKHHRMQTSTTSEHSESQESSKDGSEGQDSSEKQNSTTLGESSWSSSARRGRRVKKHRPRSLHDRLNQREMARKTYAKAIDFYKDKETEEEAKRREAKELLKELLEEQQEEQQLSRPQGETDPTLDPSHSRFGGLGALKGSSSNNTSMRITPALHGTHEMARQSMFRLANAAQMATSAVYNTTVHTATTAANVAAHMAADTTVGIGKLAVNTTHAVGGGIRHTTHAVGDGIRSRGSVFVGSRGSVFVTSLRGSTKNSSSGSTSEVGGPSRSNLLHDTGKSKSMQMREHLASLREEFGDELDDLDEEEEEDENDNFLVPPLENFKPATVSAESVVAPPVPTKIRPAAISETETEDEDESESKALPGKKEASSLSEPSVVPVPSTPTSDSQNEEPPVLQARVMAATMA